MRSYLITEETMLATTPGSLWPVAVVLLMATGIGCQSSAHPPNAVRDLLIDRIGWQTYSVPGDTTRRLAHRFAITNTSARDSYRRIQLGFDYYTQTGRRLGTDTSVIDTLIAPGTLVKLTNQRIGTLRPGTDRTDVRVLNAVAE